ncbi:hypothetical protein [Clavibacter tessellarius]|uniref:hypothetical protein n=1 Tax=Clavibacter tessellarius TaxID=31965 RepID=UPI003244DC9D
MTWRSRAREPATRLRACPHGSRRRARPGPRAAGHRPRREPRVLAGPPRLPRAVRPPGGGLRLHRARRGAPHARAGGHHPELGDRALERPYGRGINFQILVEDADVVAEALAAAGVALFLEPETTWYRIGDEETGVRQFLVTDPDGYLVRFQSSIGRRPAEAPAG